MAYSSIQQLENYQIASHSRGVFTSLGFGSRFNSTVDDKNNIYFDIELYINEISVKSTSSTAIKGERQLFKDNVVLNHDGNYDFGSTNPYFYNMVALRIRNCIVKFG